MSGFIPSVGDPMDFPRQIHDPVLKTGYDDSLIIDVYVPTPEDTAVQSDLAEKLSSTAKGILFCIMQPDN